LTTPNREYHLRELSRLSKRSLPTILTTTSALAKVGLITKKKGKVITTVTANRENIEYVRRKQIHNMEKMYNSGLVDFLIKNYQHPKLIILFGSYSRGEDTEKSDIDIAILTTSKKNLDLSIFEKNLGKPISLHKISLSEMSKEFKANLTNGIVLEGSW